MAREQFNNDWENPKKKRDKKQHVNPDDKKNPYKGTPKPKPGNNYQEQHNASMGGKKDPYTHKKSPNEKQFREGDPDKTPPQRKNPGYPTDDLFKKMRDQKSKSVKIEPLKKKTTESVLKEKMAAKEKLKKNTTLSRARALLPKTKKKKKK